MARNVDTGSLAKQWADEKEAKEKAEQRERDRAEWLYYQDSDLCS